MSSVQMEQRVKLKFVVKVGKTFTEAYAMLKEMYMKLPKTISVQDRRLRIRGLAEITKSTKNVSARFGMNHSPCAKMVPKLLTLEQKESRMNICADILNNIDTDPGLLDAVTLKRQDSKVWKRLKQKRRRF
ncbi:hypothetical protein NQ318_009718 [Aromia moschata]|uniref:Uncharacterized protein n=1 Tax=Aromia moschata TaxID=1265417 RepID=A0AAV8Y511_9CUCU|nr:hypothetical protein NQ318_009718 [Aromia moschata]